MLLRRVWFCSLSPTTRPGGSVQPCEARGSEVSGRAERSRPSGPRPTGKQTHLGFKRVRETEERPRHDPARGTVTQLELELLIVTAMVSCEKMGKCMNEKEIRK